jgi:hypothetical protein
VLWTPKKRNFAVCCGDELCNADTMQFIISNNTSHHEIKDHTKPCKKRITTPRTKVFHDIKINDEKSRSVDPSLRCGRYVIH